MKLEYTLDDDDFVQYYLYTASKSKNIKKKRILMRFLIPFIYLLFSLWEYFKENIWLSSIFLILALVWVIFYPLYTRYRYTKHYAKHVNENYKSRLFKPIKLEVTSDYILGEDFTGETKINITEVKSLTEISNNFFINVTSNASLIIPKRDIFNKDDFKEEFIKKNIPIENELNWKWK